MASVPVIICAGAIAVVTTAGSSSGDWVVRPLEVGGNVNNADVLVRPDGTLAVGYGPASGGPVRIVNVAAGERFFQRRAGNAPSLYASFAIDTSGAVHYASHGGPGLVSGVEGGGWLPGQLLESPAAQGANVSPTIALDPRGVPYVAAVQPNVANGSQSRVLWRFDVLTGKWQSQGLPVAPATGPSGTANRHSLVFDSAGRAAVSFVDPVGSSTGMAPVTLLRQSAGGDWRSFTLGVGLPSAGTSLAAGPDGTVGAAYFATESGPARLAYAEHDGEKSTVETIANVGTLLGPRSLAYDPAGNPAVVYRASTPSGFRLQLARRTAAGQWTSEVLPIDALRASLTFDASGKPYVSTFGPQGVAVLGPDLRALVRGDFNLNDAVTDADVDGFVLALRKQPEYIAAHPGMVTADVVGLGDFTGDFVFNDADARRFLDNLGIAELPAAAGEDGLATPAMIVPGLPDRKSGYIAFDLADQDPDIGSGTGNFFNVRFANGRAYQPGDARADVSGTTGGVPDGVIDGTDITFIQENLSSGDSSLDMNGDGVVDDADVGELVGGVLQVLPGDANLDGTVEFADLGILLNHYNRPTGTWGEGNFDGRDGVEFGDLGILLNNYNRSFGGGTTGAGFDAAALELLAAHGFGTVPEPASVGVGAGACGILLLRRRTRAASGR